MDAASQCRSTPRHEVGSAVCSCDYQLRKRDLTMTRKVNGPALRGSQRPCHSHMCQVPPWPSGDQTCIVGNHYERPKETIVSLELSAADFFFNSVCARVANFQEDIIPVLLNATRQQVNPELPLHPKPRNWHLSDLANNWKRSALAATCATSTSVRNRGMEPQWSVERWTWHESAPRQKPCPIFCNERCRLAFRTRLEEKGNRHRNHPTQNPCVDSRNHISVRLWICCPEERFSTIV